MTSNVGSNAGDGLAEPVLVTIGARLLGARRLVVWCVAVIATFTTVTTLLRGRTYTSRSAFVASGEGGDASRLAGLAAQFGVAVGGSDAGRSPDFYASLTRSDAVLRRVVSRPVPGPNGPISYAAYYEIEKEDTALVTELAIEHLSEHVRAESDIKTGLVGVRVAARKPAVAQALAVELLAAINEVNQGLRRERATEERGFLDERVEAARQDLARAEGRLAAFLESNRSFQSSPKLMLEFESLQRSVSLQQAVFQTLAQGAEQAGLDAARNTGVISVVQAPTRPVRPDRRGLLLKLIISGIVGVALAGVWLLVQETLRRSVAAADPADRDGFASGWADAKSRLVRPWRLFQK